jgi:hypothetical protein
VYTVILKGGEDQRCFSRNMLCPNLFCNECIDVCTPLFFDCWKDQNSCIGIGLMIGLMYFCAQIFAINFLFVLMGSRLYIYVLMLLVCGSLRFDRKAYLIS